MADDDTKDEKDKDGNPEKRIGEEEIEAGELKYTPPDKEEDDISNNE